MLKENFRGGGSLMEPQELKLTMEQQFRIALFDAQVDKMSTEQAKEMLKLLNVHYEVTKATMLELLKQEWNVDGKPDTRQPTRQEPG